MFGQADPWWAIRVCRADVLAIVTTFGALLGDGSIDSVREAEGATWRRAPNKSDTANRYAEHFEDSLDDLAVWQQ